MGSRRYPVLRCAECGEDMRLIAICEKPGRAPKPASTNVQTLAAATPSEPAVPSMRAEGWIGVRKEAEKLRKTPYLGVLRRTSPAP